MKVWGKIPGLGFETGWLDIEIGQEVTIYRCGSWKSVFGERAKLARTTKRHLVFVTESGSEFKTSINNLFVKPARMSKYSVTLDKIEDMYHERVYYWNDKKVCMEYK